MQQTLISAARYAKLRGLNRSTISRQVESGAIPTHGGLIDPVEADAARGTNLNQKRRQQAKRQKELRAVMQQQPAAEKPSGQPADTHRELVTRLRAIVAPSEALAFAKVALAIGCAPTMACALGAWHVSAAAMVITEVDGEDVADLEPSRAEWKRALGKVDFDAADAMYNTAAGVDTAAP